MRFPDWRSRLLRYLEEVRTRDLEYGLFDCCLFAAGAVEAMTGTDLAADFRGRYTTALGAKRVLRQAGYETPADAVVARLEEVPLGKAQVGDVAAVGGALGIYGHGGVYVLREGGGIGLADHADRAFRVPICQQ